MISVVINTLNEEANIAACIASAQALADEIVVCDQHSDDDTASIAARAGARVVLYPRTGEFWGGRPRRFAVEQATHEYVLFLDADERVTPALSQKLRALAHQGTYSAVWIRKKNLYFGGYPVHNAQFFQPLPLFFRREAYLRSYSHRNERFHGDVSTLEGVKPAVTLSRRYYIIHLAYPTIEKYVIKTLGFYATREAEQLFEEGQRFSHVRMITDPLRYFGSSYLLHGGFRDGTRGLVLNVLYSVYLFLRWANLWLLECQGGRRAAVGDGKRSSASGSDRSR